MRNYINLFTIIIVFILSISCDSQEQVEVSTVNINTATPADTINTTPTSVSDNYLSEIIFGLPRGLYIVYSNNVGYYAYSLEKDQKISLLNQEDGWIAVSYNGKYFAYHNNVSKELTLYDIDQRAVYNYKLNFECRFMAVASNGNWIACGGGDIFLYSTESKESFLLTDWSNSKPEDTWEFPIWSPDSTRLAYQNLPDFTKSQDDGLYITNIECVKEIETCKNFTIGPFISELAFLGGSQTAIAWSQNDEEIFIPSIKEIYTYEINTNTLSILTDKFGANGISLSPINEYLAFSGFSDTNIYLMSINDQNIKSLDLYGNIMGWLLIR